MAHTIKIILTPDKPYGFKPDSFDHLLQLEIQLPGLDTRYTHTLMSARVAGDGNAAELTVQSEPVAAMAVDQGIRFVNGTPTAKVRVVTDDGVSLLAETQLNAPLRPGQRIAIGEDEYQITADEWPHRDDTGMCRGEVDWQHAYAVPVEPIATMPVLARVVPGGPAVAGAARHPQPVVDEAAITRMPPPRGPGTPRR